MLDRMEAFEARLARTIGRKLVRADLREKRRRMAADPHAFLRGSCFWFAQEIADWVPTLTSAERVLAVGDIHIENFGLWRDADVRLVWGVNDFDEAALLPWPYDLIRLAASAMLADGEALEPATIAAAVLRGYAEGLAAPQAKVLMRDGGRLRRSFAADAARRKMFWTDNDAEMEAPARGMTQAERDALLAALPEGATSPRFAARQAGLGSLGRPRFMVRAELAGAPVLREIKVLAPSCFGFVDPAAQLGGPGEAGWRLATGPGRASDPFLAVRGPFLLRRLGPDSRKLDGKALRGELGVRLLRAMGTELGTLHAADPAVAAKVLDELRALPRHWLANVAAVAARATRSAWRKSRKALREAAS
jgi:hypothetical protein